jgi:hypothetical protein
MFLAISLFIAARDAKPAAGQRAWRRFRGAMPGSQSLLSSCAAASSSDAANPGCFRRSSLRTYSMFSVSCLTVFIAIAIAIANF